MDPVTNYYVNQAGSGIQGFEGIRFQKGNGFFSSLWSRIGLPVLKFLGKQAVNTGLSVASDALEGRSFKESAIEHLKKGGKRTVDYLKELNEQTGSGRKRRKVIKRRKTKKSKTVRKKKSKRRHRRKKSIKSLFA